MPVVTVEFPPLLPMQQEIHDHPARFKVVAAGRRSGKTRLGVIMCLETGLRGGTAWWVAPTYKVARIGWRQLVDAARQIPGAEIRLAEFEIRLPGGGRVAVRSDDGDKRGALRGEALDFVVLDECAYISEVAWRDALRPALSDRQGGALFISTPAGFNWFHELWATAGRGDNERWAAWRFPTSSNPHIPADELDEARSELGSHTYAQEYEAEFVEVGGNILKADWIKYWRWPGVDIDNAVQWEHADDVDGDAPLPNVMLVGRKDGNRDDGRLVSIAKASPRFVVVDPALSTKQTADYTAMGAFAVTPDRKLILLEMVRDRMESPDVLPRAEQLRRKWRCAVIYFESVAYQKSLVQAGRREGYAVKDLRDTLKHAVDKDKVSRAMTLGARMEGGDVFIPSYPGDDGALERELTVFPEGAHDDQVDVMSYAAILLPEITRHSQTKRTAGQLTGTVMPARR